MEEEGGQRLRTVWWSCKFEGCFCIYFSIRWGEKNLESQINGGVIRVPWRYSANERRSYMRKSFTVRGEIDSV